MGRSILEKMGCSNSKTSMEKKKKKNEPLHLCKERKRFVKQVIDSRCALAAAHVSYTRSLRHIGACLRQYAESEETVVEEEEESSPSLTVTEPECHLPSRNSTESSPLSHNSTPNPKPHLNLTYMKKTETMNSTVVEDSVPPPPSRPRRPETSSWDYFDTCDDFDSFRQENVAKCGSVRTRTEQKKQSCEDDDEGGEDGEREDASEFITHRAKDFVSSMKDIEHKFFRACESGKEVSRMLEANKIRVGFADMTGLMSSVFFSL